MEARLKPSKKLGEEITMMKFATVALALCLLMAGGCAEMKILRKENKNLKSQNAALLGGLTKADADRRLLREEKARLEGEAANSGCALRRTRGELAAQRQELKDANARQRGLIERNRHALDAVNTEKDRLDAERSRLLGELRRGQGLHEQTCRERDGWKRRYVLLRQSLNSYPKANGKAKEMVEKEFNPGDVVLFEGSWHRIQWMDSSGLYLDRHVTFALFMQKVVEKAGRCQMFDGINSGVLDWTWKGKLYANGLLVTYEDQKIRLDSALVRDYMRAEQLSTKDFPREVHINDRVAVVKYGFRDGNGFVELRSVAYSTRATVKLN